MVVGQIVVYLVTQGISWAAGQFASWQARDDIRKAMADVDAYMQSLWGGAEWASSRTRIGNIYRTIAERAINERKRMISLAKFNADRGTLLVQNHEAFKKSLSEFALKMKPYLDKLLAEIHADDVLKAKDAQRLKLYEDFVRPAVESFVAWAKADPRRVIESFFDTPQFPMTSEGRDWFLSQWSMYESMVGYLSLINSINPSMVDVQGSAEAVSSGYGSSGSGSGGSSYIPKALVFPEFVDMTPQGLVTRDVTYYGRPDELDALRLASTAKVEANTLYQQMSWEVQTLLNFVQVVLNQGSYEMYASISGRADLLSGIAQYRELEHLDFKQTVPDDLAQLVKGFYVFERRGIAWENVAAKLSEYVKFPSTNIERWLVAANGPCGEDGKVYSDVVDSFASDGESMFSDLNDFFNGFADELELRASRLAADVRLGDIFSGVAVYRNPVAVKLLNADGTAGGSVSDKNLGPLVAAGATLLFLLQ